MTQRISQLSCLILALVAFGCDESPEGGAVDASPTPGSDASSAGPSDGGPRLDASVPDGTAPANPLQDASGGGPEFNWPDAASADAAIARDDAGMPAVPQGAAGEFKFLTVDGRMVSVYLPPSQSSAPVPLVFSMHGLSIPAVLMADITSLPQLADKEGFVAVFPEGSGGSWNTGGSICGLGSFVSSANDDVAYVEKIVKAVQELRPIDESRVFMSGFSMGGYATNNLACKRPKSFRAGAPAAGGYPTNLCDPAHIPMIIFHGTSDGTITYDCGKQARDFWATHNGCSAEVDVKMVTGGKCEWNRNCPADGQVVFCSFDGMGHGWAGSYNPLALGGGPLYESATTLMWDFFKTYL